MQRRLETLREMGIEVWRLRPDPAAVVVADSAPVVQPAPAAEVVATEPETASRPRDNAVVPEFRLAFLHYETVGLCLSLARGQELPRRLCDDIAGTLGGNVKDVRFQMLEWPMLSTSGIDQSDSAARQVVTQKFGVLPARVIVFGQDVKEYYRPLEKAHAAEPLAVGRQQYLLIDQLKELMGSSQSKRQLLAVLSRWN